MNDMTSNENSTPMLTQRQRLSIVVGLLSGRLDYEEVCRQHGLERETLVAWEEAYILAIEGRKPRIIGRPRPRLLAAAAVMCLVSLTGLTAYATNAHCASGLICFSVGEPARASQVNANFATLKQWMVARLGSVDSQGVEVSDGSPWRVSLGESGDSAIYGLRFHDNPAGGSGDRAWVRYVSNGSGSGHSLRLGIANDTNDDIQMIQAGVRRLQIVQNLVGVQNSTFVTDGNASIGGNLLTNSGSDVVFNGNVDFQGDVRLNNRHLMHVQRFDQSDSSGPTSVRRSVFFCTIGAIAMLNGDIQENNRGDIMKVYTYAPENDTRWFIRSHFRTHNNSPQTSQVGVACYNNVVAEFRAGDGSVARQVSQWWTAP
jgi:hypothetical protein